MQCSNWCAWRCNKLPSHVDNYRIIQVKFLAWYYGSSRCRDCRWLLILCRKPNISSPPLSIATFGANELWYHNPRCCDSWVFLEAYKCVSGQFRKLRLATGVIVHHKLQGMVDQAFNTTLFFFPRLTNPFDDIMLAVLHCLSLSIHGHSIIPSLCRHGMIFHFSFKVF